MSSGKAVFSWILLGGSLVLFAVALCVSKGQLPWASDRPARPRPAPAEAVAPTPAPVPSAGVWASLSRFTVNRNTSKFTFRLELENEQAAEKTVYAVVYGNNDKITPPRRSAWPNPEEIFLQAGTERGMLSPANIMKDWDTRPEKTKGTKIVLKPRAVESVNGSLPMEQTSPHKPWEGKPLDSEAAYTEVSLWVFSEAGGLIVSNLCPLSAR